MGELRDRMIRELQLRRFAPATQKAYLEAVVGLTKHFRVAPDHLSAHDKTGNNIARPMRQQQNPR